MLNGELSWRHGTCPSTRLKATRAREEDLPPKSPRSFFGMLTHDNFLSSLKQKCDYPCESDLEDFATGWPRQLGRSKKCPNLRL